MMGRLYGEFHLLAIPPLFFSLLVFLFYFVTDDRPSRVNRIESLKGTDAFPTERQRERGVVTHLS
jgi:hypothetical protein